MFSLFIAIQRGSYSSFLYDGTEPHPSKIPSATNGLSITEQNTFVRE